MPMLLIKGSFQVKGARPDGDSVHFTPDKATEWNLLHGTHPVKHNTAGRTQLRLDAIDAPETHYAAGGPEVHQPLTAGRAAADELLAWLGFTGVQRDSAEVVTAVEQDSVPGFILTRGADKYGRCVAVVGRGNPPAASGTQVHLDVPMLQTTANHHMLKTGLAYPTYYRDLFPDLRAELTAVVHQAQKAGKGLWPNDVTTTGVKITSLTTLTEDAVILPKLFRRLVEYVNLGAGNVSLAGFAAFLAQTADRYLILSTGHFTTGLDYVVEVSNGNTVKMTEPAENLVFDEG